MGLGFVLGAIDSGNTAWVLVATALVLFMTPGLALFYGGMVRSRNVLAMLLQNVFAMGLLVVRLHRTPRGTPREEGPFLFDQRLI